MLRAVFGVREGPALERLGALLRRLVGWTTDTRRALVFAFLGPDRLMGLGAFRCQAAELDAELLAEIARRREMADLGERTDILSLLSHARAEDGGALSDRELRDELLTLLVAGHENDGRGTELGAHRDRRSPHRHSAAGRLASKDWPKRRSPRRCAYTRPSRSAP